MNTTTTISDLKFLVDNGNMQKKKKHSFKRKVNLSRANKNMRSIKKFQ